MDWKIPLRPARRLGGALLTLALFVALAVPANAAPRGETPFFASAWRLLSALFDVEGFVVDPGGHSQPTMLFGETGLDADPSGLAAPTPPLSNTGLVFDPNG